MASPFDFSSFLLTPPIPNYPSASEAAAQAAASNNASNSNNGNYGGNNLSSSLPNSTYPSALPQYPSTQGYGNNAGVPTGSSSSSNNYMQQPQSQQQQYGNQQSMQSHTSQSYQQPQQVQQQQSQPIQQPQYQQPSQHMQSAQQQQQQQNNGMYYTGDQSQNNNAVPYNQTSSSGYGQYQEPVQQQQQQQQHYPVQQSQQQQAQMMPQTAYMQNYGQQQTGRELPPVASGSSLRTQYRPQQQQQQSGNSMPSLDERDYGLDPSAFSNVSFQMPSFLAASSQPSEYGSNINAPPMVDPSAFYQAAQTQQPQQPQQPQQQQDGLSFPLNSLSAPPQRVPGQEYAGGNPAGTGAMQDIFRAPSFAAPYANQQDVKAKKPPAPKYTPDVKNPVYGIYGSSVISINPDTSPFKLALNAAQNAAQSHLSSATNYADDSRSTTPDFDPKTLGLPVGDQLFPQPLPGLYSSSGFDMLGVLARVVARPNPQINIGPVDTSCAFLVVDARRYDMPIVFASDTFSKLTGYSNAETIGRNCRFLQAPDGHVAMGSRRKYTDGNAVYHLKSHIQSGKETQASIINYRKDGSPFINLVTIIPISWDTDEIAYFVGFQVDLVEQPNAILEKMKNGTYVVNYSLLPTNPPPRPAQISARQGQEIGDDSLPFDEPAIVDNRPIKAVDPTASGAAFAAAAHSSMTIAPELLEVMNAVGEPEELDDETAKKRWNKMLLDHTGDFVHVLSLKGSFLYVSPSVKSVLEYDASDLVGKTLQSVCHPSDIVPVMRELKESSNMTQPVINLLYRIRRKHSGYIWLEAQGKLYLEQSKSRKCVILVGRERPVYKLSWNDLRAAGGLGEKEFWSKVTHNGMFLYNTPTVKGVVGHDSHKLQGKSLYDLVELSRAPDLAKALADARAGKSVRLRYKLRSTKGNYVDVVTNFYPNSHPASPERKKAHGIVQASIVLQTNEYSSEIKRRASKGATVTTLPPPAGVSSPGSQDLQGGRPNLLRTASAMRDMIVRTPEASDDGASSGTGSGGGGSGSDSSAPSTFSAIPSTYKTLLSQPTAQSDNLFDELDTTRTTSWQYELHQLKLTNKKLKEELAMLQAARRKRKKKEEIAKAGPSVSTTVAAPAPSANASSASGSGSTKLCANCGRTDSPEWRIGPTGVRNLCNACGLRWAKATKMHRQSSNTPSGNTSSSGNSDFEGASSFLQPAGPFAVQRPPLPHAESSNFNQSGH